MSVIGSGTFSWNICPSLSGFTTLRVGKAVSFRFDRSINAFSFVSLLPSSLFSRRRDGMLDAGSAADYRAAAAVYCGQRRAPALRVLERDRFLPSTLSRRCSWNRPRILSPSNSNLSRARVKVYANASEQRVYSPDLAYDMALGEFSKNTRLVCHVLLSVTTRGWKTCGNDNAQCASKTLKCWEGEVCVNRDDTRAGRISGGLNAPVCLNEITKLSSASIMRSATLALLIATYRRRNSRL